MMYMVHLCTKHDENGNPRKAYVLYESGGWVKGAWYEGYSGIDAVPEHYRKMAKEAPYIATTPSFLREIMRSTKNETQE